jgi:hypothetical protein
MKLRQTLAITGLSVLGLGFVYAASVLVLMFWTPVRLEEWFRPRPCKAFSTLAWKSTRFGDPERYKMANELVRTGRLLGKSE